MNSLSLVLVLLLPLTLFAQKPAESQRYRADSIVAFFLGDEVFQRYVKLDTKETKQRYSQFYIL